MKSPIRKQLRLIAYVAVTLLIVRVVASIVFRYHDYFPPNFYSEFLTGRKGIFSGAYRAAFYVHILSSPLVLFSGMWLLNGRMRARFPVFHRRLGRVHALVVLLLVAPSGLWMSRYALTGASAGIAFALSACATFGCAAMGWRSAVKGRFAMHQVWMMRCFLLLCSAIVLRLLSGAATVAGVDALGTYPLFAWLSSVVPIAVYEGIRRL